MNTKLNSLGYPLLYVGGEESTRKGKTRKKRKEGRVTEEGMVKVISFMLTNDVRRQFQN